LPFDVIVKPATKARPGLGDGFVGELDRRVVTGDEPGGDEHLQEVFAFDVRGDGASRNAAAYRLTFRCRGDKAQQQVT
jgi:hypothetical protein